MHTDLKAIKNEQGTTLATKSREEGDILALR